jgi:3',5'-cyclic AMP phosphodiesterase CpdA
VSNYLLIQISDVHLTEAGPLWPGVHPRDNLLAGLRLLDDAGVRPDVFVLTGDLADSGAGVCYEDLTEIVGAAAEHSGAGVVYLPGNHDDRTAFRRHLLGRTGEGPINQTYWRDGLRIIAVDSTVPGAGHGFLDTRTLDYLRTQLDTAAPDGTVVALHHPSIPSPVAPMAQLALRNPGDLRDVIAGSDVRIVLCGHNHHSALGTAGSVPVWVSPATAYQVDVTSIATFRGLPGSAMSRIDLSDTATTATVIPIEPP